MRAAFDVGYILGAGRADVKQSRELKLSSAITTQAIASYQRSKLRRAGCVDTPGGAV